MTGLVASLVVGAGVFFAAPAFAAPTPNIVITSPTDGSTLDSTSLVVTGTAPVGATVRFYDPNSGDAPALSTIVDQDGVFVFEITVHRTTGYQVEIRVFGETADGIELAPAEIVVTAMPYLPAPVIASPASGSTLTGPTVTFSGTAVPGEMVSVSAYDPIRYRDNLEYSRVSPASLVDPQGNWTATIELLPGEYIGFALLGEEDETGSWVTSEFSAEVTFNLAAAGAALPVTRPAAELAATGSESTLVGPAGLALLVLGATLVARRRRVDSTL